MLLWFMNTFARCFFQVTSWTGRVALHIRMRRAKYHDKNMVILSGWLLEHKDEFPKQVQLALQLIDQKDPRRAKSVRNNIRIVADSPVIKSLGQYDHKNSICVINYDHLRTYCVGAYPLDGRNQHVLTLELASLLIHEATHGRLEACGISYTDKTWEQIERICVAQEAYFLNRICSGCIDLRGNRVEWLRIKSIVPLRDSYVAFRAMSPWDRLRYLFQAANETARRQTDEDTEPLPSILDTVRCDPEMSSWSEMFRAYKFYRSQPPLTPAMLEGTAQACSQSGLPVAAAECYKLIHSHGWEISSLGRYFYGRELYTLRRFQDAMNEFKAIENQGEDLGDAASLMQAYCLRGLERFEDAEQLVNSIQLESVVETKDWFHLGIAMLQNDAVRCFEILKEIFSETKPEHIMDDEFWSYAMLPYLAWLLERDSDYRLLLRPVIDARKQWLSENEATTESRRAIVVYVDDSMKNIEVDSNVSVILVRTDQDITDDQFHSARTLAAKISGTIRQQTLTEYQEVLQGLLYGNDKFTVRDVDWEALKPADRMEGNWQVVNLPIERIFLQQGRLEGDMLNLWMNANDDHYEYVLQGELDPSTFRSKEGFPDAQLVG